MMLSPPSHVIGIDRFPANRGDYAWHTFALTGNPVGDACPPAPGTRPNLQGSNAVVVEGGLQNVSKYLSRNTGFCERGLHPAPVIAGRDRHESPLQIESQIVAMNGAAFCNAQASAGCDAGATFASGTHLQLAESNECSHRIRDPPSRHSRRRQLIARRPADRDLTLEPFQHGLELSVL
jgi:hypothetical protein